MAGEQRVYESDNRDGVKMGIVTGNDGDYHLSVWKEGRGFFAPAVRFCLSGGAAHKNPRLLRAVAELYRALGEDASPSSDSEAARGMEREWERRQKAQETQHG